MTENQTYDFRTQLKIGKEGEEVFLNWGSDKNNPIIQSVLDVREDPRYQNKDIDFVCVENTGTLAKYEIKCDSYETGNFFAEFMVASAIPDEDGNNILDVSDKHKKGWLYGSEADKVFYYFSTSHTAYIIDRIYLGAWLNELLCRSFRDGSAVQYRPWVRGARNVSDRGYEYYGLGYVVSIKEMMSAKEMQGHVIRVEL